MKHVLSIQDLSCVGRCSLTVTLPVLSAMGCRCSVLPTAVLSTHTAFPNPEVISLTDRIAAMDAHWQSQGIHFDAVLTGYMADAQQAEAVLPLVQKYKAQGSKIIVDPAMGDHGKLYRGITQEHVDAMRDLATLATAVLPNVTEAAMLTGLPYQAETDGHYLRMMLDRLCMGMKTETVIITGTESGAERTGFAGIQKQEGLFSYRAPRRNKQLHGTGDMFSAVFTGGYLLGKDPYEAGELAAKFVEQVLDATETVSPFGASFEKCLPWLWEQL